MKYIISFCLISLLFSVNSFAQLLSGDEINILKIQDERNPERYPELVKYIQSDNPILSVRALLALANIQDSAMVKYAGEILLNGKTQNQKSTAAFALGETGTREAIEYLADALKNETDKDVLCAVLNAVGLCGNTDDLNAILDKNSGDPEINKYTALSIARFAIRGIKNQAAINKLISFADSDDDSLQIYTSYAFSRVRDKNLLTPAKHALQKFFTSQNAFVRMWAYYAMAYAGDEKDLDTLINNFKSENDINVRVAMLTSLSVYKNNFGRIINGRLLDLLLRTFEDKDLYVRLTALEQAGNLGAEYDPMSKVALYLSSVLEQYFNSDRNFTHVERAKAVESYAKININGAEKFLLNKYSKTHSYALKPDIVRALKYTGKPEVVYALRDAISRDVQAYTNRYGLASAEMIQDDTLAAIYRAFTETLDSYRDKAPDSTKNFIRLVLMEFAGSKDAAIVDVCFNALNSEMYKDGRSELEIVTVFDLNDLQMPKDKEVIKLFIKEFSFLKSEKSLDALKKLAASDDYEISNSACDTIKNISGEEIKSNAKRKFFDDYENLKYRYAVIRTNKGDIKLRLLTDIAPMTCLNFIRLAQSSFYDKTLFHRVIPNFVIQGGDPLNTGWGGTEYTIRSEFSPVHFSEGKLGMASDGKDTEGSQFFIMHIPHLHLDGKYTVFGEVTDGMDVVNKIFTDDYVISVSVSEN